MRIKSSALLLTLAIVLVLSACGKDAAIESTATPIVSSAVVNPDITSTENTSSPTPAPQQEATATPEATAVPQASIAASSTPVATTVKETPKPTATPVATSKPTASPKPRATTTPTPVVENNNEVAQALFKQSCTSCHGVDLEGDFGPNLQKIGGSMTKEQITTQIANGGDAMPSFNKKLKAEEIEALAVWLAAKK